MICLMQAYFIVSSSKMPHKKEPAEYNNTDQRTACDQLSKACTNAAQNVRDCSLMPAYKIIDQEKHGFFRSTQERNRQTLRGLARGRCAVCAAGTSIGASTAGILCMLGSTWAEPVGSCVACFGALGYASTCSTCTDDEGMYPSCLTGSSKDH